ncbi:MAG TPA: Crp/Fnr family transcriptional regulator [Casimicrobiaceae bacterium]|jgi:CRP-like cAMP-binding protein|nr:Crp/Fnr family transcriptional regulator [Casimicrobiaceae bacterium]
MPSLADFVAAAHWASGLDPALRERAIAETGVRPAPAGSLVCRKGEAVEHWIGVVDGLVKMANVSLDGKPTSFTGIPSGGWFGEGSLLKDEPRRYDIVALRDSTIAYMPRATFMALLDESVAFNRFLLIQLNERLGQFIGMVEHDRLLGPDARLARGLAALFNPHLYPGIGRTLPISQGELGQLVGLSRQRVNQALQRLEQAHLLRIEYGAVTVLDLEGLRAFED